MLKMGVFQSLGLGRCINRESRRKKYLEGASNDSEPRRKKELGRASISLDTSLQLSRDISVRIVHAGGREELYQNAVPASQVMEKYPGMYVARSEVFKNPHESLLCPEEDLLPGQKYYIIPSTTAHKLKRRHPEKSKGEEEKWDWNFTIDAGRESMEDSICYASDFYASKARWSRDSRCSPRKCVKGKRPFRPPLPKAKSCRGLGWEPSLTSVQELSP
jgi:hypothetical protein